jgi:hypothetical protein
VAFIAVADFATVFAVFMVAVFLAMTIFFFHIVVALVCRWIFSMIMLNVPVSLVVAVSMVIPEIPAIGAPIAAAPELVPTPESTAAVYNAAAVVTGLLPVIISLS